MNKVTMLGHGPSHLVISERLLRKLPLSVICSDTKGLSSGSMDGGGKAILKSLGEFSERAFFYHLVQSEGKKNVSDLNVGFVYQMELMMGSNFDQERCYEAVTIWNIFNGESILVPINLVSLGLRYKNEPLCGRDTSGCAVHPHFEDSLNTALYEFIERQLLIRYWLTDHDVCEICAEQLHPVQDILSRKGVVRILDLSDSQLGVHCYFVVFLGDGDPVWFSSSLAAGPNAEDVLVSAMEELWQIYSYVRQVSDGTIAIENVRDKYQKAYLEYNTEKTHEYFKKKHIQKQWGYSSTSEVYSLDRLRKGLKDITDEVYIYHSHTNILGRPMHAIRVLSPDFFMHIMLSARVNRENKFSSTFGPVDKYKERLDLPFP